MEFFIEFADAMIRIAGDKNLIEEIYRELKPLVVESAQEDLQVNVLSSRSEKRFEGMDNYYAIPMYSNAKLYPHYTIYLPKDWKKKAQILILVDESRYHYKIQNALDYFVNLVWKWYDRTYISLEEAFTYSFINNFLEPITLFLFPTLAPLVHSAGMALRDKGVLISGVGGVGKTTTSLRLLLNEKDICYLNDDMALIDGQGNVKFYPRKMIVYEYNLRDIPELRGKFRENQSFLDRVHWILHNRKDRNKMRRRRLEPHMLFGEEKVCKNSAPLKIVLFLEKSDVGDISFTEMSYKEYSSRMADIMMRSEFNEFARVLFEKLHIMESTGWKREYMDALSQRFEKTNARILKVSLPKSVDYKKLENGILQIIKNETL